MKKIKALILSGLLVLAAHGLAFAEHEAQVQDDKVKVLHCSMCDYTVPSNCPHCGMKMEEKEMTAADAQAAIDKSKDMIRNRA